MQVRQHTHIHRPYVDMRCELSNKMGTREREREVKGEMEGRNGIQKREIQKNP